MKLNDLKEKFHGYDTKISSKFHKNVNGVKKPSWGKIILVWIGLIVLLSLISVAITSLSTVDVDQELTPISSLYNLNYNSSKSSTYYIYYKSGNQANDDAYNIAYNGKLKVELDTSDIPHSDHFEEIMNSYSDGENEYNATVDFNLTAYDKNDVSVSTKYFLGVADSSGDIVFELIDLLFNSNQKISINDGILTITGSDKAKELSDSPLNSSLKNIDHIEGVINVYNKNVQEPSDPGFYNYTLKFTIPKDSIRIKNS